MGIRHNGDDPVFPRCGEAEEAPRLSAGRRGPYPEETEFPALDIYETAGELVVEAELPGVDPGRIEVAVSSGALVIEGMKEEAIDAGRVNFLCMERSFGAFRRVVPLACAVDISRSSALYRAGILQVRVPKVEEKRGQRRLVPVQADDPAAEE